MTDTPSPSVEVTPCPLCADPMQVRTGMIRHLEQGECLLGALAWPIEQAARWNTRLATHPEPSAERRSGAFRPIMGTPLEPRDREELEAYARELETLVAYNQKWGDDWRGIAAAMGYEPRAHQDVRPTQPWLLDRIAKFRQEAATEHFVELPADRVEVAMTKGGELAARILRNAAKIADLDSEFMRDLRTVLAPAPASQTDSDLLADLAALSRTFSGTIVGHHIERARARLAALTATPNLSPPSGYVLVPVEPTPEMEAAHFEAHARAETVFASVPEVWAAMLAAAPSPPVLSREVDETIFGLERLLTDWEGCIDDDVTPLRDAVRLLRAIALSPSDGVAKALAAMERVFGRTPGSHSSEQTAAIDQARQALAGIYGVQPAANPCAKLDPQGSSISGLPLQEPGTGEGVKKCPTCEGKGVYDSYDGDGRAYEFECYTCEGKGTAPPAKLDPALSNRQVPDPSDGTLAARIRAVMDRKGLSLRDVATKAGIGFSTVGRALRGEGTLRRTDAKLRRWLAKQEPRPAALPSDGMREALEECADKLWILRCNSRDPKDREAAERACEMARTALAVKESRDVR